MTYNVFGGTLNLAQLELQHMTRKGQTWLSCIRVG